MKQQAEMGGITVQAPVPGSTPNKHDHVLFCSYSVLAHKKKTPASNISYRSST